MTGIDEGRYCVVGDNTNDGDDAIVGVVTNNSEEVNPMVLYSSLFF